MNSLFKSVAHFVATMVLMYLPLVHADLLNLTVGGIVTIGANWVLSHFVATTTGASATQG